MIENFLSIQDSLFLLGFFAFSIKIYQLWKEGKFKSSHRKN